MPSNYEYREGGRIWVISKGRFINNQGNKEKEIALISPERIEIKKFRSITECAEFLGVSRPTVARRVQKNQPVLYGNKSCWLIKVNYH